MSAFSKLLSLIHDGMTITLTASDAVRGDNFLIFDDDYRPSQTLTFHTARVPYWIEFDCDEPIRLEDCPPKFFETLVSKIEEMNEVGEMPLP